MLRLILLVHGLEVFFRDSSRYGTKLRVAFSTGSPLRFQKSCSYDATLVIQDFSRNRRVCARLENIIKGRALKRRQFRPGMHSPGIYR